MERITQKRLIRKGWSGDRKYRVRCAGELCLLRVSSADRREHAEKVFRAMKRFFDLGIPMCEPLEMGVCEEGIYALYSWIDGKDAEKALRRMSPEEQYAYGLEGGRILRRMHTLRAPKSTPSWEERFGQKIDRKLRAYRECPVRVEGEEHFLRCIEAHRELLAGREQVLQHGDYHAGNLLIGKDGRLCVIDFDRFDVGDPWEEFNRIVWDAEKLPDFASGMIDGYFEGAIPADFWPLLALYLSVNALGSIPWAIPYGAREIGVMRRLAAQVLSWYGGMTRTIPAWYRPRVGIALGILDGREGMPSAKTVKNAKNTKKAESFDP
ncbi:MAG: phosphotransferase [Clostridia bacterium]|nr:phosphotransferase [Clostridia bacterium]